MKKLSYSLIVIFISVLFAACPDGPRLSDASIKATNNSSYSLYIRTHICDGEIEPGEEYKLLSSWGNQIYHDKGLNSPIEFYYKRTDVQKQAGLSQIDQSLLIKEIDDANSILEVIEYGLYPRPTMYISTGYITYKLVITNEMLGLPDLSEEEQP
jgi:hypothetical protein